MLKLKRQEDVQAQAGVKKQCKNKTAKLAPANGKAPAAAKKKPAAMKRPAAAAKKKPMAKAKAKASPKVRHHMPESEGLSRIPARLGHRQYWDLFAAEPDIVTVSQFSVFSVDESGADGKWIRVGRQTVRQFIIKHCGMYASLRGYNDDVCGECNDFEHNYCMVWYKPNRQHTHRMWSHPLPLDSLVRDEMKNGADCMIRRISPYDIQSRDPPYDQYSS